MPASPREVKAASNPRLPVYRDICRVLMAAFTGKVSHIGAPGWEAVATCLASPEVRARTAGMIAWRPEPLAGAM